MSEEESYQRGMVVVAHADDAEFGCSGTIAKWCHQGTEIVYVICTDGSKGSSDPQMTSDRLAAIRRDEQIAAGDVLGLKEVVFLGYEDSMLQPTLDLRRDIAREIRRHKPEVVICQSPVRSMSGNRYYGHPDHFASGEATMSAIFPAARDRLTFPELLQESLAPHHVQEVLIMHAEKPDIWVDVTDYIDTAIRALKEHVSQLSSGEDGEYWMRKWRGEAGTAKGVQYAECFKQFRLT